jgi:Na+-driven multidrug efflux pump
MNFVFYYLIGLPVGISLALLTDLGATGMWTGLSVAVFLTVSCDIWIILF